MDVSYIETFWRKADSVRVGEGDSSYLQIFDKELASPTRDPNLVSFVRALYITYRANLEQALSLGEFLKDHV